MNLYRFALNGVSRYYSFFDPDSQINLSLSNPVGYANRITPLIIHGLNSGRIIDVDNVVDLRTGAIKGTVEQDSTDVVDNLETDLNQDTVVDTEEVADEVINEETTNEEVEEVLEETETQTTTSSNNKKFNNKKKGR